MATKKESKAVVLHEEMVSLGDLKPHPKNYKKHPEDQMTHLVASIKQLGMYKNVVVARDKTILAGHGVVEAAKRAGLDKIPVRVLEVDPDSTPALKILANDNELGHFADIDDFGLADILKEIKEFDPEGLLGTGYDDKSLANLFMVANPESKVKNMDEAAQWVGMPEYDPADDPYKLVINFETEQQQRKFLQKIGCKTISKKMGKVVSIRWPLSQKQELKSIKFREKK